MWVSEWVSATEPPVRPLPPPAQRETTNRPGVDSDSMTDTNESDETPEAVAAFIDAAEDIYYEYNEGYLDPDAALSRLGDHVAELRDTYED